MALFIIISGALLMLGGAASVLFGFEIVVTERGSAMVISGTVALAGGLVALGIGFALLRLSQLLGMMEPRNVRPMRPLDRPVVPIGGTRPPETDTSRKDTEPESSRLHPESANTTRSPGEAAPTRSFGTMAAVGGLAAAAAVGAGITGARAANRDDADADDANAQISNIAPLEPEVTSSEASAHHESKDEGDPIPEPSLMTPDDLEAELAQALAETDPALPTAQAQEQEQEPEREQEPEMEQESEREQKPGLELPRFLSKSATQKNRKNAATKNLASIEPSTREEETQALGVPSAELDHASEKDLDALSLEQHNVNAAEARSIVDEPSPIQFDEPESKTVEADSKNMMTADDHTSEAEQKHKSQVLGTYNSGGRTYTMYADGTVEAMTENGIQHFASMEELRLHLSRA